MLKVIEVLSEEELLTLTPTNVDAATRVLIVHDHPSGAAHTIVIKDNQGVIKGSFRVPPDVVFVIKKEKYDTIEEPANSNDIYVTKVAVTG